MAHLNKLKLKWSMVIHASEKMSRSWSGELGWTRLKSGKYPKKEGKESSSKHHFCRVKLFNFRGLYPKLFDVKMWPSRKKKVNNPRQQVNILTSIDQMGEFEQGQVLVADMTDPDWEPIMILGSWTSKRMEDSKEFYVVYFALLFYVSFKSEGELQVTGVLQFCWWVSCFETGLWPANLGWFSWPFDRFWTLKGVFFSSILIYPFLSWSLNPSPTKKDIPLQSKTGF